MNDIANDIQDETEGDKDPPEAPKPSVFALLQLAKKVLYFFEAIC